MPIAVRRKLVSCIGNSPYKLRVMIGDPAQYEKGPLHFVLGQQVQNPLGIVYHVMGEIAPLASRDIFFER